jgi:hypothetical protein
MVFSVGPGRGYMWRTETQTGQSKKSVLAESPSQQSLCSNVELVVRVSPASKDVNAGAEDAMMLEDNW